MSTASWLQPEMTGPAFQAAPESTTIRRACHFTFHVLLSSSTISSFIVSPVLSSSFPSWCSPLMRAERLDKSTAGSEDPAPPWLWPEGKITILLGQTCEKQSPESRFNQVRYIVATRMRGRKSQREKTTPWAMVDRLVFTWQAAACNQFNGSDVRRICWRWTGIDCDLHPQFQVTCPGQLLSWYATGRAGGVVHRHRASQTGRPRAPARPRSLSKQTHLVKKLQIVVECAPIRLINGRLLVCLSSCALTAILECQDKERPSTRGLETMTNDSDKMNDGGKIMQLRSSMYSITEELSCIWARMQQRYLGIEYFPHDPVAANSCGGHSGQADDIFAVEIIGETHNHNNSSVDLLRNLKFVVVKFQLKMNFLWRASIKKWRKTRHLHYGIVGVGHSRSQSIISLTPRSNRVRQQSS